MSQMTDRTDLLSDLRLQLDELATNLVLNGPGEWLSATLQDIASAAMRAGKDKLAQLAADTAKQLPANEAADEFVGSALTRMQELLNSAAEAPANASSPALVQTPVSAPVINPLAQDPELVGDFIVESREHLGSIENNMLTLDRNPEQKEAVHAVFRGFHTIKGLAGFLEFMPIRDVAHEVETLLDYARNGKLAITGSVVDVVLESVDYLKQAIAVVEASLQGDTSPLGDNAALIGRVQRLSNGESVVTESAPALKHLAESIVAPPSANPTSDISKPAEPETPAEAAGPAATGDAQQNRKADAAAVIRVQTAKLDYLMDMIGEMVITQSLIRHSPAIGSLQSSKLLADLSQLARITGEVQRTAMGMRMITLGQVFQRSSRLIRDLCRKQGKQVELEISGEETEVDKTIAEELTDPLLHMVRNACDHGIEGPEERIAAGKPAVAKIKLSAYHQGGQIVIEIADNGRGLAKDKILAKAVQKGLIDPNAHLSEQEIFNLIFEPGFSTAAQITDLSGRGVGMDVVRRNIQKLRGRIDIQSKVGQGTTFFLKLPLTLAIIEGLVVGVGDQRYIVPIYAVRELISPKADTISTVHGKNEMAMVRDHVLPVLRLSRRFNVKPKSEEITESLLVVTECQEQQFCLLVDEVLGKQEVVIKSLGETLKNIPGIAGGAILGDGRVGLILDLEGVFRGQKQ